MSRHLVRFAPFVGLILVLAVAFGALLESPGSLIVDAARPMIDHAYRGRPRDVGNDLTSVFLPRFAYIVAGLRSAGRIPLWDASGFGGRPFLGNPQAGLLYPPVWAAYLTGKPASLGWLTLAHLLVAGLGAYALTRDYGFSRGAALVSGGCFEASPFILAHAFEGHAPHVWAACWYPWAFWALERAKGGGPAGRLTLPIVLALAFLTGHPQEWYYLVLALSAWVSADVLRHWWTGSSQDALTVGRIWVSALALSLGLSAVTLLPELVNGPWLLKASVIPIRLQNRYQLQFVNLLQLIHPFALGKPDRYFGHDNYWETLLSAGLAPLALAIVGLTRYSHRALSRRWGVLTAVAVAFAGGRRLGLYPLAYATVPGMDRFRVPSRTLFLASLGAAVLAGAGVDALVASGIEGRTLRRKLATGLASAAAVVILFAALDRYDPSQAKASADPRSVPVIELVIRSASTIETEPTFWAACVALLAVGLASYLSRRPAGSTLAWGLGTVALLELSMYGRALLVVSPVEAVEKETTAVEVAQKLVASPSGPLRVASVGQALGDLGASLGGLEKPNVNDVFQLQHAADVYERLYPFLEANPVPGKVEGPMDLAVEARRAAAARAAMDVLSVGVLASEKPTGLPGLFPVDPGPRPGRARFVWRNPTALPRAYVVPRGRVIEDRDLDSTEKLLSLDPRQEVVVANDILRSRERQPFTPAEWKSDDPSQVRLRVDTWAAGYLVVSNAWMPGWSATVDGQPAPVLLGNTWQQVVPLPGPGRHRIDLRYRPPGLATGLALSLTSLAIWGFAAVSLLRSACGPPGQRNEHIVPSTMLNLPQRPWSLVFGRQRGISRGRIELTTDLPSPRVVR